MQVDRTKWNFKASYTNSRNETIEFGRDSGVILDNSESDIWNYSWNYSVVSNRISSLSRKVREIKVSFLLVCDGEARNDFLELVEYDAREGNTGVLEINGYKLRGCFIESDNADFWYISGAMRRNMTFLAESKLWYKEVEYNFNKLRDDFGGGRYSQNGLYDYGLDYGSLPATQTVNVSGRHRADFRMVIWGAVENPSIVIGDNTYRVNVTVPSGGYLVIDSQRKTVLLVNSSGIITNVFNKQDKSNYIFKKIQNGTNSVSWGVGGSFGFDLTVYEERSEPVWT